MNKLEGGNGQAPAGENLMVRSRTLQRGKRSLEGEIKELTSINEHLQKELEAIHAEVNQMERTLKEKEEVCAILKLQHDKSEQDFQRELKENQNKKELLEQYKCEIQEFKLRHRKLRMRFENQLQNLMEKHKKLHCVFAPERLPDELKRAENKKTQLQSVEKLKLSQLHKLDEELEVMKKENEIVSMSAQSQEE